MTPLSSTCIARIHSIVDDIDDNQQRCLAVTHLETVEELLELAQYFNWDDGMEVPQTIIDHPKCDLGLALHLFQLAEGIDWLTSDSDWEYQEEWAGFCKELAERIINQKYSRIDIAFESGLMKVQQYKAKKNGVPDIFLNSVKPMKSANKSQ